MPFIFNISVFGRVVLFFFTRRLYSLIIILYIVSILFRLPSFLFSLRCTCSIKDLHNSAPTAISGPFILVLGPECFWSTVANFRALKRSCGDSASVLLGASLVWSWVQFSSIHSFSGSRFLQRLPITVKCLSKGCWIVEKSWIFVWISRLVIRSKSD